MVVHRRSPPKGRGQLPNSFMERSFLAAFLYRLFLAAALFALFLPFLGPMLDHHVAERYPYHAHIYFSPTATEHVHFYEDGDLPVHHHEGSNRGAETLPREDSGKAEVVYLTANDGWGQSATSLAITSLHVDVLYPAPDNSRFLLGFGEGDNLPPEAFVPPPRIPPRA